MSKNETEFDIALSFADEDRKYVKKVANTLDEIGIKYFYDEHEKVTLWGKDLYVYLREIYEKKAKYTVMFISEHYANKLWTNHERQSAQTRAFTENQEYILPARFDKTEIPGLPSTIGYINLNKISPKELALMIKKKIGYIERKDFFPKNPDRLYKSLSIRKLKEKERVLSVAQYFHKCLGLMKPKERSLLYNMYENCCAESSLETIHINIEYLSRIVGEPKRNIIKTFREIDCLGFYTKLTKSNHKEDKDEIKNTYETIEVKFDPCLAVHPENSTYIMIEILSILTEHLCPDCVNRAIEHVDFSVLSQLARDSEKRGK